MFCGGLYWQRLRQVLHYYPRHRVHVVISENLRERTRHEMSRIYRFLKVDRIHPDRYESRSSGGPPMNAATEAFVRRAYRPHNEMLFNMLGLKAILAWN
jgi:hypothetical protein